MHGDKYAIVCMLMLLMLTTAVLQSMNQVKAGSNQYGWDNGSGYAAEIHASAAGVNTGWSEGFENGWPPAMNTGWSQTGNIQWDKTYPHSGSHDALAYTSGAGQNAQIYIYLPLSTYVEVEAYVEFIQAPYVPQGSTSRLELVYLSGGDWTHEVAASINNPYGSPVWTLETYEGGSANYNYGTHTPIAGTWYKIDLIRDITDGVACLYVNGVLEAYQYRSMTQATIIAGFGIGYQSNAGTNKISLDDITFLQVNGDPTTGYEDSLVQTAANNIFNLFAGSFGNYYGHLENYMQNDNSYSTPTNVKSDIHEDETTYLYSTFLYIGHGGNETLNKYEHDAFLAGGDAGQSWDPTLSVWDYQVNQQLNLNSLDHYFVFLWACFDGNNLGGTDYASSPYGMPYSWTDGLITSSNGYASSDSSGRCLISFRNASPMLSTDISNAGNNQNPNQIYKYWLVFFYYYTLTDGYSVYTALNSASYASGYSNFGLFPSYNNGNGNLVWWVGGGGAGMGPGWYPSTMRVYGDTNTYLAPYSPW